MYELNRVRLVGIGPRGARYPDVTLDLSDLGELVPPHSLFDSGTRRPSPSTLLLLENGGGKSVLLKLLFSVVLPGRRNTVGGSPLENFVLDTDTGHVALEWMNVSTGERLVTAKVYQRRTRTASNNNPLTEAWYSFRPTDSLDLGTLPFAVEGRRRRLDGYRDTVEELDRQEPEIALSWMGDDHGRWRDHLRECGIEPDLFDIQRRMNVDEGEAAKAFKYASSKDFVNWLITTVSDPKDVASVAETFGTWSANLAEREQMVLEQDFLEGTLQRLEPVGEAYRGEVEAAREMAQAQAEAERLTASLAARHRLEAAKVEQLEADHAAAAEVVREREGTATTAREIRDEVRLQTFRSELAEVEADRARVESALAAAELEMVGWELVPAIDERDHAIAGAEQLAAQVRAADEDAAPAQARRDLAAGRLLAKYDAEAAASDTEVSRQHELAGQARERAAQAEAEYGLAHGAAMVAQERYGAARKLIDEGTERLTKAAQDGLVPAGTAASDTPELSATAAADHAAAVAGLDAARMTEQEAGERIHGAERALTDALESLGQANRRAEAARRELDAVVAEADRICSLAVITDAFGPGSPDPEGEGWEVPPPTAADLDDAAERLLDLIEAEMDTCTEGLDTLRARQAEDARIIQALGEGGLLPARAEVTRAVEVLETAGIPARPGWRYLNETVRAGDRAAAITAHPGLADGVALVDAGQLPQARQVLGDAQLLPAAAVVVGAGEAMLAPVEVAAETFVVEPTPALYDEEAATERREELRSRMVQWDRDRADQQDQLGQLREAHSRLARWRVEVPPGRFEAVTAEAERTATVEETSRQEVDLVRAALDEARTFGEITRAEVMRSVVDERTASDRASALSTLAVLVAAAAQAQGELAVHEAATQRQSRLAEKAMQRRAAAEVERDEHLKKASQASAQAERYRDACKDVWSTSGRRAEVEPTESLPQLRAEALAAQQVYLEMSADPDLRRLAEEASQKARNLRTALGFRDPAQIAEAERLRSHPEGADTVAWRIGAQNARAEAMKLRRAVDDLTKTAGQCEQKVLSAAPTEPGRRNWAVLEPGRVPTSVEHGQQLEDEAHQELIAAENTLAEATSRVAAVAKARSAAEAGVRQVREAMLPLTGVVEVPITEETVPFSGDVAEAVGIRDAVIERLRATRTAATASRGVLTTAVRAVVGYANQNRFEVLNTQARRSILDSDSATLAQRATEWAVALRTRLATLAGDLQNANRHRKTIVDRLTALVDQALRALRQAVRLSRLPEDLAEWSGKPFLRIQFRDPDNSAIAVRIGEVVDRMAAATGVRGGTGKNAAARRDGMTLLLESMHAAVPNGFVVDVLKPDSVLRDERVSIEDMNNVFSGGQELTAAIVLYCTLAALRANERGQMRSRHSGVLFLDNPIGRANASYLLDLQKSVAHSLGVQLIYTTGISDDRVLAAFPLWIRLRNDADLRAGLKHIRVADVVRNRLPEAYSAEDATDAEHAAPGTVTATRVYQRPPAGRSENAPVST
ncbi:hypothetical protein D1871_06410 [Nakamurella silvestris]|nr:hypothetical protein D1871_06410 [Nakamurella silvestris]